MLNTEYPMPNTQCPVLQTAGQPKNAPALSLAWPGVANREWAVGNREFGPGLLQCFRFGLDWTGVEWSGMDSSGSETLASGFVGIVRSYN